MKIHEIIVESTELEEGWKSKLGAAALAGAAALGGGAADAGGGMTLNVVGKTYDSQGNTIVKYQDGSTRNLGTNEWTSPTMAQQRRNQALAKQKADREAAARASRQPNYAQKNMPQQQNFQSKFDPTQDPFLMDVTGQINKDIGKFKSELESNPTASEKNNVMRQIDSRIKYYSDYINDVKAARGVSSEENLYLVDKLQGLGSLKDTKIASTPSKYGDTVVDEVPLGGPWQKYYTTITNDMNRDIVAVKNELRKQLTPDQKIAFKKQLDSAISTYITGPNGLEAAGKAGLNKDAIKILNKQLDQLKSLSSSIKS